MDYYAYTIMKLVDIHEAVKQVQSKHRVFVHGVSMTPTELLDALCVRHEELMDVELVHIHTEGPLAYANEAHYPHLRSNACFVGKNLRGALNEGYGDYIPIFLSEISGLFRKGYLPIDVAFIHASPPDKHGYCSLGTSLDVVLGALDSAKVVIALLNPRVPKMQGDAFIHQSKIDFGVAIDRPLIAVPNPEINGIDRAIAAHVAALIEDKSCLQKGIGAIPNAVLEALIHHKGLGVHTEMFSDGVMDLI